MSENNFEKENQNKEEYIEINIDKVVEDDEKTKKKGPLRELLDWVLSIGIAVLLVALLNMFVFVQVAVDGNSMYPTLHDKDRLIASRFLYTPKAGDIVVVDPFLSSGTVKGKLMYGRVLYIKRVVATEGQTIDIKNGKVYIDGKLYEEDYIPDDIQTMNISAPLPLTVPENCVFVMGDNRENSRDSRDATIGVIRNEQVVGKAVFRWLPFSDFGVVK